MPGGRQRWVCRRCQYQFTRRDGYGTPDEVKQAAVTLYGYGLSLNAVGHLLGSCAQSVMRWVCSYVDHTCPKPEPEPVPIIEVDEMWHYVHRKTNRVWIWKAYDREKDRLIDWECGVMKRRFDGCSLVWNVGSLGSTARMTMSSITMSCRSDVITWARMRVFDWSATTVASGTGWHRAVATPSWCRDPAR
jgi:hypothetical protein